MGFKGRFSKAKIKSYVFVPWSSTFSKLWVHSAPKKSYCISGVHVQNWQSCSCSSDLGWQCHVGTLGCGQAHSSLVKSVVLHHLSQVLILQVTYLLMSMSLIAFAPIEYWVFIIPLFSHLCKLKQDLGAAKEKQQDLIWWKIKRKLNLCDLYTWMLGSSSDSESKI